MSKIGLGIVGLGYIFEEYLKVISSIKDFEIVGVLSKSNIKAIKISRFNNKIKAYQNIKEMMTDNKVKAVMILVNPEEVFSVLKQVIPYKKTIFTEKPVGINFEETKKLNNLFIKYNTPNMVGFNRRFYSIFEKGIKAINKHGGITSMFVEGHERFWKVNKKRNKKLLYNWIYANSSHTIDLLRFFGGEYKEIFSFKKKIYKNNGDHFSMILKSKKNILSTYISNWYSPGGWTIKLFGNGITVVFDPLEEGYIINKKFQIKKILPNKKDIKFKPGFYKQMIAFKYLIEKNKLKWPAQDIKGAFKTVTLIKKILQ